MRFMSAYQYQCSEQERAIRRLPQDIATQMATLVLGGWGFTYGVISHYWWARHPDGRLSPDLSTLASAVLWAHNEENA